MNWFCCKLGLTCCRRPGTGAWIGHEATALWPLTKGRYFPADVILVCVSWYCRYSLSYRDLEEMMIWRGVSVDHTTVFRWVQRFALEIERRVRSRLRRSAGSWRVDETYISIRGVWHYLYRAVDKHGHTIDFFLSPRRDVEAAKLFFRKALANGHVTHPRVINVDKNAAYPAATAALKDESILEAACELRQVILLNKITDE